VKDVARYKYFSPDLVDMLTDFSLSAIRARSPDIAEFIRESDLTNAHMPIARRLLLAALH
jgi:hypothetical protein